MNRPEGDLAEASGLVTVGRGRPRSENTQSARASGDPPREEFPRPDPLGTDVCSAEPRDVPSPETSPDPAPNPSNESRQAFRSAAELRGRPTRTRLSACRRALSSAVPAPAMVW